MGRGMLHFSKIMCIFAAEINVLTMKHYKTLWLLLMIMMGGLALTSCSDKDDQESSGGGGEKEKDYVERMYPVVDPKENSQGTVTLRFYNDMPNVAYISVSRFQEMIYPGTTIQVQKVGNGKYALKYDVRRAAHHQVEVAGGFAKAGGRDAGLRQIRHRHQGGRHERVFPLRNHQRPVRGRLHAYG